jgi:hypothetical protein
MKKYIIITSINGLTKSISDWASTSGWHILIVGDKKSIHTEDSDNIKFLSLEEQMSLNYDFIKHCPENTYTRKNIGYLYAIEHGAKVIYETDDDNSPYDKNWTVPEFKNSQNLVDNNRFINIYKYFTDKFIWPRGLPLEFIKTESNLQVLTSDSVDIGVWQGVVDKDPDVDAIYRLILGDQVNFTDQPKVHLSVDSYCPFNSQNTFWSSSAFPFLYLPVHVRFRVCDILRSYIAQRLMWEFDLHLGFFGPSVYQDRNEHNLITDFEDEIDCYISMVKTCNLLDMKKKLSSIKGEAQLELYKVLAQERIVQHKEIDLLEIWTNDLNSIVQNNKLA